ncbi:metallophosphoesterase [Spirosoma sp. HMF3257]|uniref:Metallophosphoesterase n=1 Tax=Spirosoma telluris TaxID=2183553 RepID=A0A327NGR1_9BACT|nr:metallophosphoesterase [Spirosoma telluris]RAI74560.1 metallophosphoesterase [Spirosoma telluris]
MKFLTISDLHGRTVWKEANLTLYDRVIFLGDYTDSYIVDDETIYTNLNEIIQLKIKQPEKFVLLIGNHDAQYLHFPNYRCSGFRAWAQSDLTDLFIKHKSQFQMAYQHGLYLFTHAGVTNKWLNRFLKNTGNEALPSTPTYNLARLLNEVHNESIQGQNLLFDVSSRRGGHDPFSGPIWADRSETKVDYLAGFYQVVGHTPIDKFITIGDEQGSITYTDVLQTKTAFYEITIPD